VPAVLDNPALAMYVAAAVALIVVLGFFWYLWSIDRGVRELRRRLDERPVASDPTVVTPLRPRRRVEQEQHDGNTGG
jgi:hypothetical protein